MASHFWTPEKIAKAVAKTKRQTRQQQRGTYGGSGSTIPDAQRLKQPYHSVGVLMFSVGKDLYHGTAYVTNASSAPNVILTAAHNLVEKGGESSNILFIPAVLSDSSRPYGEFPQIPGKKGTAFFVHPRYDVHTEPDAYDLGAVKLQKNATGKDVGDVVTLLNVEGDKSYKITDTFRAIGYPEKNEMQENIGAYKDRTDGGETVNKHGELPEGSSGGPWFLNNETSVNGNTASGARGVDSSPYYSTDKIGAIISQMTSVEQHSQSSCWLCCFK